MATTPECARNRRPFRGDARAEGGILGYLQRMNVGCEPDVRLVAIGESGSPAEPLGSLPEAAVEVCAATAALYGKVGFRPPWIGYLALRGTEIVGTCAFTASPSCGRVEVAYFTFPAYEGRGIATAMARSLLARARTQDPDLLVFAHTLPVDNASNRILRKLGFAFAGEVEHAEEGTVWEWRHENRSRDSG